MNANEAMGSVQGWARAATGLGVSLVGALVVVQVLFPGAGIDIIGNIKGLVSMFSGLSGLITLLVLVAIMSPGRSGT